MMTDSEVPQQLKPVTPQTLTVATLPVDRGEVQDVNGKPVPYAISAYRADGEIIAYCDSTEPDALMNYTLRNAVYAFRMAIGMASAGMEPLTGISPVMANDSVPCLIPDDAVPEGKRVYRRLFRYVMGI